MYRRDMDMTIKAVGYVRVSTQEQAATGISLEAQAERIEAYCTAHELDLVALVSDEAISGTVPLADRKGGAELLDAVRRHSAEAVVAVKLDRLFRDASDALGQTKVWDKEGLAMHLLDMGGMALNTGTAMGRMWLTMLAGFAEFERNLIAERTAAAIRHLKAQGRVYNHTPLGFDAVDGQLVANEDEAVTVERILTLRTAGKSLGAIANALNADGVTGKLGGKFYASTVSAIIGNGIHHIAG